MNGLWSAPRALGDSVRPRRLSGVVAGPLNFTVRWVMSRLLALVLGFAFIGTYANEVPRSLQPLPSAPTCASPAPLYDLARTSPQGILVRLKSDVADPEAVMSVLTKKNGFTVAYRFPPRSYFVAAVTQTIVDALRCEPEVESVTFDAMTHVTQMGAPNNRWRGP